MPSHVIESIIHKAVVIQDTTKDPNQFLHRLGTYAQVCNTWRDVILSSRVIKSQCKDLTLSSSDINDRRLMQSGFLSIVGQLSTKMDYMRFVQEHIRNNVTAINDFTIEIEDNTNIKALADILAMSPKASTFTLDFIWARMNVQKRAEQFWKVLLIVFHCNAEDKTVTVNKCHLYPRHGKPLRGKPINWNFIKKAKLKNYHAVPKPGTVKRLHFSDCHFGYSLPDLNFLSVSIECISLELGWSDGDLSVFNNHIAEWVLLQVSEGVSSVDDLLNDGLLTKLSKYDRIEVHFGESDMDYPADFIFDCDDVLSTIEHQNLHFVLAEPFRVIDVFRLDEINDKMCSECYFEVPSCWKTDEVNRFVTLVQESSAKTFTYLLPETYEKVTFNCDANFKSTFMAFLDTQPLYIGSDWENFTTLQLAKESFDPGRECYCFEECEHCDRLCYAS